MCCALNNFGITLIFSKLISITIRAHNHKPDIVRRYRSGDFDGAADVFYRSVPLMRFEFQDGIGMAIRKEVLRRRGVIACAGIRPPGAGLDSLTATALDRVLAWTEETHAALAR